MGPGKLTLNMLLGKMEGRNQGNIIEITKSILMPFTCREGWAFTSGLRIQFSNTRIKHEAESLLQNRGPFVSHHFLELVF